MIDLAEEVGFERPLRAAALMAAFPAPWCVAGDWALDLFLGRLSRAHDDADDVEVAIFRDAQRALHDYLYFSGWTFSAHVDEGGDPARWDRREWLEPPVYAVRAESPDGTERLAVRLEERRGRQWRYRRCPAVARPLDRAIRRGMLNVPVLAPEVVLLHRADAPRPEDLLDCRATVERLDDADARPWLTAALRRAHAESPFLPIVEG